MSTSETRTNPPRAGFTLLECMVAIVILNLLLIGMVKLIGGHHQVLDSVDDWSYGAPVYYVVPDPDPLARAIGVAATLEADPPSRVHRVEEAAYDVTVLEVWRDLEPPRSIAVFRQTATGGGKKGKKE